MKRLMRVLFVALACLAFSMMGQQTQADPLIYVDFDDAVSGTFNSGDLYALNSFSERGTSVTAVYIEVLNGDGVVIDVPAGDNVTAPSAPGPQGGKAMMIDAGTPDKEEALNWELSNAYPIMDITVEVTFWMATNNNTGNDHPTAGVLAIQNIWSSSWPCQDVLNMELRNIGNAGIVGRPADSQKLEIAAWQGDGTELRVVSANIISAPAWHTAQVIFDYNEGDPANSSVTMYLDGVLEGSVIYDATASGQPAGCPDVDSFVHTWAPFGSPALGSGSAREGIGAFRFILGGSTSRLVNGADNRGLQGAIDAFALSEGALTPAEFVLPLGFEPPVPLSAKPDSWVNFE